MIVPGKPRPEEVDDLLRNAQLRDELEPLLDESVTWVDTDRLPVRIENEFLESMLAWERAPMVPISQWFDPELVLPPPDTMCDDELRELLWQTVHRLYHKRIVLDFTDHLSDRELYCLIYRDLLPTHEKKLERGESYLHWDCSDCAGDPETWLKYYATDEDRRRWAYEYDTYLPPHEEPPFRRELPQAPM